VTTFGTPVNSRPLVYQRNVSLSLAQPFAKLKPSHTSSASSREGMTTEEVYNQKRLHSALQHLPTAECEHWYGQ